MIAFDYNIIGIIDNMAVFSDNIIDIIDNMTMLTPARYFKKGMITILKLILLAIMSIYWVFQGIFRAMHQ